MECNYIKNIDCLDGLKYIDNNSIDLIVIDPPYFNQGTQKEYSRKGKKSVNTNFGDWDVFEDMNEYLKFMEEIISECHRVLKENGSMYIFINDRYISYLRTYIQNFEDMRYSSTIVWKKRNPPPRFIMKATYISSKEFIMFAYKGNEPTFNKPIEFKDMLDVWETNLISQSEHLGHPTQKPEKIIDRIILTSSNENDIVLDLFNGSGTTTYCARKLNRRYIGFEKEKEYYDISIKRMDKVRNQNNINKYF